MSTIDTPCRFTVDHLDQLILTFRPEELILCPHCSDLHVVILPNISRADLEGLAAALVDLAGRIVDGKDDHNGESVN